MPPRSSAGGSIAAVSVPSGWRDRAAGSPRVWRLQRKLPFRLNYALGSALVAADVSSFRSLLALLGGTEADPPVWVALRTLGGRRALLRPGRSDGWVARETLPPAAHLPPREVDPRAARIVWDLGANVGLTAAHLATVLPSARVFAVELDAGNAAIAEQTLQGFGDRCDVQRAGVATEDGTLTYGSSDGTAVAFRVGEGSQTAPAVSLDGLLARSGGPVDYVKMDIEGAEREVLRGNTSWAAHVRTIAVEVHPPYTPAECRADLASLGFVTRQPYRHPAREGMPTVIGVRTP